ncbi:general transcription factor II-I repeat domain-containing protein 2-like [Hydra vulgaris]|uniref:General transcription factor II-I repeat domain-containing protein 2-like n=1 Tax=Hydra vulgaris TaxID=6087 RepID=A0ABM4CBC4_HYDVU
MSHSKPSASRKRKIEDEKRIFQSKWEVLYFFTNINEIKASYSLAHLIAFHSRPFTDGEFIKNCLIKTAKILCPEKIKDFNNISLSRNTVAERVNDIATDLRSQLTKICKDIEAFSIAVDESTDVKDVAQLSVFIRGCNFKYEITEELLELIPMHGTTTGADIFLEIEKTLDKYELPITKLVSIVTDGAPAMIGLKKGLVEVLCGKTIDLGYVIKRIASVINFIRAKGLNHRQFASLLNENDSEYEDLPYYTEVRWLSCHKVLKAFNHLKTEILLETKGQDISDIKNTKFLQDLAFLVDITKHLNDLNIILQGKNKLVTTMFDNVRAFQTKLLLWERQIEQENLVHFETCKSIKLQDPNFMFSSYSKNINNIKQDFEVRFQDFKKCEPKFALFTSPFNFDIEKVEEDLQMELIELQCDSVLKQQFTDVGVPKFYSFLPPHQFPKMIQFACQICVMFGSTYLCEQLFSHMKQNKTPERSRLTDEHLSSIMKVVASQNIKPDLIKLSANKRCQISGKSKILFLFTSNLSKRTVWVEELHFIHKKNKY